MQRNWPIVVGVMALLAMAFTLAVIEDAHRAVGAATVPNRHDKWAELLTADEQFAAPTAQELNWALPDPHHAFLERVFLSGPGELAPHLAGPFATLRFGMSRAEVEAAVPGLGGWEDGRDPWYPGASLSLEFDGPDNALRAVAVGFSEPSPRSSLEIITHHWGAALTGPQPGSFIWFDPSTNTRALLTASTPTRRATLRISR
jgi:hypothetical protein